MPQRYTDRIKAYCESNGIVIPPGFFRHPASQYAAIDVGSSPPRLIAKTWFKQEDLAYYLEHLAGGRALKLLDFKEHQELQYRDGQLFRCEGFFS